MMKRRLLSSILALTLVLGSGFLPGCSSQQTASQNPSSAAASQSSSTPKTAKITIAYQPHITGLGGLLNAVDNGYFKQEGLDVNLVQFTSGSTELAAMASGEIDVGYLGVGAHVFAPQGQCVILALDSTDLSGEIMARTDSGYKSMKDLKGKNVAISTGTTSELVLSMALKKNGMQKSDVNMVNMDASGKVTAFMSGKIDAISIEAPYTDQIRTKMGSNKVTTLCSSKDFLPDAVFTNSWVTTKKYLAANPDLVVRFLKAWLQGTQYRYDHMDDTVKKVATYIHTDYATAHMVVEKTNWLSTKKMKELWADGTAMKWYDTMKDMFLDAGLLKSQYNISSKEYVKPEYLLKAMKELGM